MLYTVYVLVYLTVTCSAQGCERKEVPLDKYYSPEVCSLMAVELGRKIPDEFFYCTERKQTLWRTQQ